MTMESTMLHEPADKCVLVAGLLPYPSLHFLKRRPDGEHSTLRIGVCW